MKMRNIWWLFPAVLVLGSCKKKEPAEAPGAPPAQEAAVQPGTAAEKPAVPVTPALSPEERAAKLGFVRHLPQDTGVVISLHNGTRNASRIKASKWWKSITGVIGEEFEDLSSEDDSSPSGPAALFAKEFTIAVGAQVGDQTANLLKLYSRMNHFQMRAIAKAVAACAEAGDFSNFSMVMAQGMSAEMFPQLLSDPESGVALLENMSMPPLYLAFGTTPENRDAIAQQLASSTEILGMMGEMVEPVEVEKNGEKFAGHKVSGAKVSEMLAAERASIEAMLEPAMVDRLIAALAKKDLVVVSGLVGEYAVFFVGSSVDDLVFADDIGQSLVAGDALAFCDSHLSKELAAVVYGRKEALTKMLANVGGFAQIASGLREGMSGAQSLGDTRDLQALLQMVGEREAALRALMTTETAGTIAFLDEGLKIEAYGGFDSGKVDWTASNRLAGLKDLPNLALFTNMTSAKSYGEAARSYLEALMETAYAMAMKVAEFPMENDDLLQFREMAGLFDRSFRRDAVAVWDALSSDMSAGLGKESALIIDLNGTPPPVPGVPQNVVNEGKFPRISLVAPVTERAKLAAAWQKIDASATNILAKVSEMQGTPIPMQKPISSERDGFTTWFFPVAFFTDDFLPSVTVGDQWFAASTSKNQALDLLNKAGSGESGQGLTMLVNFGTLREFVTKTTELLEKNPDTVVIDQDVMEKIRTLADALSDLDQLHMYSRKEAGVLRTSIHLKTH